MNRSSLFRTNSPPVVHETIGGETILVHLETGTYYDLNGTGGFLFGFFVAGSSIGGAISAARERYSVVSEELEAEIEAFASTLLAEQLLIPASEGADGDRPASGDQPDAAGDKWVPPALNKHTDMQELLLLDPVHEVDETGWPAPA